MPALIVAEGPQLPQDDMSDSQGVDSSVPASDVEAKKATAIARMMELDVMETFYDRLACSLRSTARGTENENVKRILEAIDAKLSKDSVTPHRTSPSVLSRIASQARREEQTLWELGVVPTEIYDIIARRKELGGDLTRFDELALREFNAMGTLPPSTRLGTSNIMTFLHLTLPTEDEADAWRVMATARIWYGSDQWTQQAREHEEQHPNVRTALDIVTDACEKLLSPNRV